MREGKVIAYLRRSRAVEWFFQRAKNCVRFRLPRLFLSCWRWLIPPSFACSLPCGMFSLLDDLAAVTDGVSARLILSGQGNPVVNASSLMVVSKLEPHTQQPWPVFWRRQDQAWLVGDSLALRNRQGQLCAESVYRVQYRACEDPAYWHIPSTKPLRLHGRWTSLVSRWVPATAPTNYAHWILEALPRLAVLSEFPPDTSILVPRNLQPFQRTTLELLGLTGRIRATGERDLIIEEFYFITPSAMIVCYDPYAVRFLRNRLLPKARAPKVAAERVFIRRGGGGRNAANSAEMEGFFQRRGWTVCDLAEMDFTEQMGLFASARAVCGIHGAGFTNCVWCQPGTKVLELFCDDYLNGCFEWLCQVVGAEHHYEVFPSASRLNAKVDLKKLETVLDRVGI